ncbi:AraC family transcriptional regulator [Zavarzinia compransoris]|uniref:AraC family transcriptional regulator n=1 Tax=Zavarzinia marina TaxID=2911065 RepID=UPI001F180BA7|nr:AraC family transcriptional regulator [Zavarzinia marina]MCF4167404.1 AraC family transcriptional regulator [Zavarzinia marina]
MKDPRDIAFPAQYLEIVQSLLPAVGLDLQAVYRRCGITAAQAFKTGQTISGRQLLDLMTIFIGHCPPGDMPTLLLMAHFPLTIHGPVGMLAVTSQTLGDALAAGLDYHPLIMPAFAIRRHTRGRRIHVTFEQVCDFGPANRLLTEAVVCTFLKIGPFLARPPRIEVHFRHAPDGPDTARLYGEALGADFTFDAPVTQLVLGAGDLAIPLIAPSRTSRLLMRETLEHQRRQQAPHKPVTAAARNRLQAAIEAGRAIDAAEIAEALALSLRTFSRRLADEGTTLPQLRAEVGTAFAELLLAEGHLPIAEIARRSGFESAASFARAFKRMTGQTPTGYRGDG